MKRSRGFTLIELLVVVAIIGILATVVVVNLSGAQKKARDARRKSDYNQISSALGMYFIDYGNIPEVSNYDGNYSHSTGGWNSSLDPFLPFLAGTPSGYASVNPNNTQYMSKVPVDPTNTGNVNVDCGIIGTTSLHYCWFNYLAAPRHWTFQYYLEATSRAMSVENNY